MTSWGTCRLGDVLTRAPEQVELAPTETYKEVTIRLWGKGVQLRREVEGSAITAMRRFVVREGQFLLSRIDARNGALGLVPFELDGAVVSNDFPAFDVRRDRLLPEYLGWLSKTRGFVHSCRVASEGTTNRVRLQEDRFLGIQIPLPTLAKQGRIVAKVERLAARIKEARQTSVEIEEEADAMLRSVFARIVEAAPQRKMGDVAPLVRRKVEVKPGETYPELGVRSFGKGSFHKPSLEFLSVGSKKLYHIELGDLVFNNVFAWEGAVAVAQPLDEGRVGSHRFITCVPKPGLVTADFLCFYFLTDEGLEKLGQASPGGAGRNRTLGLKKLTDIGVPVPPMEKQLWFDRLQARVHEVLTLHRDSGIELDAMLPSILDKAFKEEL